MITRETLSLAPGKQSQIARLTAGLLGKQAAAGVDAEGNPLRGAGGRPLTLRKSGDLFREISVLEDGQGASLEFRKPYAGFVFQPGGRFNSLELSPPFFQQLEQAAAPLIAEGAQLAEE